MIKLPYYALTQFSPVLSGRFVSFYSASSFIGMKYHNYFSLSSNNNTIKTQTTLTTSPLSTSPMNKISSSSSLPPLFNLKRHTALLLFTTTLFFSTFSPSIVLAATKHQPTTDSIMSTQRQFIESTIKDNDVVIFSKSYCPYCRKAKSIFDEMGVKYTAVELDIHNEGAAIQGELAVKTNQRTVPNVFIKGHHVGGADNTVAAQKSGKLQQLLDGPRA